MHARVRHITAVLGLLSILLSAHGGLVTRILFEIRHEYIAEHHCENRFNPNSNCDGFCFLKKRMADHHQHDHEQKAPQLGSPVLYFLTTQSTFLLMPHEERLPRRVFLEEAPLEAVGAAIEHPPRQV